MHFYRVYLLDDTDRIDFTLDINAVCDADAIEQAQRYGRLRRRRVEVWRDREIIHGGPDAAG